MTDESPGTNAANASFSNGEFVYDAAHPWDDLRGGIVSLRDGIWQVWFPAKLPEERHLLPTELEISSYPGDLKTHVLINAVSGRGPNVDLAPWAAVQSHTLDLLRDITGRQIALDDLIAKLRDNDDVDDDFIEPTLRMMACMGTTEVIRLAHGLVYRLSGLMRDGFDRREYLATFSDELLVKSRRIDLLVSHKGTVGNYREELLRGLLRQLLPRQYEASTGFIENCARQLDVIVWDSVAYSPLFREQDVVVVPRQAVRAVIEVKTTLSTGSLDEAMHILWETFRRNPESSPVFKGIFAFEAGYKTDLAVAERMRDFYLGSEPDGIIDHEHMHLNAGVSAICVPNSILVREHYRVDETDLMAFPQPYLSGLSSRWPGDTKMPFFLGQLLLHLDLPSISKSTTASLFDPILSQMENVELLDIYPKWLPQMARADMALTLEPEGARLYVERVRQFMQGKISGDELPIGLRGP